MASALEVAAGASPDQAEINQVGTTDPVIGGYLLSQWGMGYHIVEAITCHPEPWSGPAHDLELDNVVRVADHLAARDHAGAPDDDVIDVDLPSHGPAEWVCLSSQAGDVDDTYERVGLLGAVRMYHQGFATRS